MGIKKKIEDFWLGNIILWKSYWLVGELFNAIVIIIILNIMIKYILKCKIPKMLRGQILLFQQKAA